MNLIKNFGRLPVDLLLWTEQRPSRVQHCELRIGSRLIYWRLELFTEPNPAARRIVARRS